MPMNMDESSMASGVLMGAGLRELSQVLNKAKPKTSNMSPDGAQPPAAQMAQGNLGDIDRIMLLAKLQGQGQGGPPPGGPPMAGPPPGMPGLPPGAGPMPLAPSPLPAPPPGGQAAPLPQPGAPLPPGMPPPGGAPPNPLMAALGGAAPGGGMGGGPLPMQLLTQLLMGSQGLV